MNPRGRFWESVVAFGAFFALLVGMLHVLGPPSSLWAQDALRWEGLTVDGQTRTYAVYAPAPLPQPAPLVFLLHGGGGSAERTWAQEAGRAWRRLAEAHGFLLVLPQGRADPGDPGAHHWNDCRVGIATPDVASALDDVGFVAALVDVLSDRYRVDPRRIYATGASNGGMMSYRLAFELGDRLAAIGAVIANLPEPSECGPPETPVPVLIMNGTEDPLMPYGGGCVASERCDRGRVASTEDTVDFWVRFNGASPQARVEALPDRDKRDGSTVTRLTHPNATGPEVVLYRVDGGGHAVPGAERIPFVRQLVVGSKNRDIDGPEAIWRFFERHARD